MVSLAAVLRENPDARLVVYPLRVRDRVVGVLRIANTDALNLSEPQRRFLEALAHYAALRGEHRDGLPVFADGARAATICEAVLASPQAGRWTEC